MPPSTLEGNTLGEKHKNFNKLVKDVLSDKEFVLTNINSSDGDIDNLIKIDVACKTRNVDYITDVLRCDDMLYISRAIKQSTWLITEKEFAHIINPEYLYTELFPYMLTSAIKKLLLQIRLHLKDEKRVEEFYEFLKSQDKADELAKWLPNCSVPFQEDVIQDQNISLDLYKRLCRRSVKFLHYNTKINGQTGWQALREVVFLVKTDTEEYVNVLFTTEIDQTTTIPLIGKKHSQIIMEKFPDRVLENYKNYWRAFDLSVVAKNLTKDGIKDLVLKYLNNENTKYIFNNFDNLELFIKNMREEDRLFFLKTVYIKKNHGTCGVEIAQYHQKYISYQYAPFEVAFSELKKVIDAATPPIERCVVFTVLITCANNDPENTNILLKCYEEKFRKEHVKYKVQFLNNVVTKMATYNFNTENWHILDRLFINSGVYSESEYKVQDCLKAIFIYKVLHDEKVPDFVDKKLLFKTFKEFKPKLNQEQQIKLFSYMVFSITNKLQNITVKSQIDLVNTFNLLEAAVTLFNDWKQDVKEYPFIIEKLKNLAKENFEYSWPPQLRFIYTKNKSFQRQLFEESIVLYPSEMVCLNALKHNLQLLERHSDKVDKLRTDDKVSLNRLLSKLRVYWPHTLAKQWTEKYLENLNCAVGLKAIIKGLFVLLPKVEATEFAMKYAPRHSLIRWNQIDPYEISIRENIANNLHMIRPLVSLDTVLLYAKGDYLQYVVPSLNAITHNISKVQSCEYISKFLEGPVSIQKYGLNLAFTKLKYEELKPIFASISVSVKKSSIQVQLFTHTYNLLSKVKDPILIHELWNLLSMFIDHLPKDENKIINNILGHIKAVPKCIQAEFFMKSYRFLASLPALESISIHKDNLIHHAPNMMAKLDPDFVANIMIAPAHQKLFKTRGYIELVASYILHGRTEDEQCMRLNKVVTSKLGWNHRAWVSDMEVKYNVDPLIRTLTYGVRKYLPINKIVVPVKCFLEIEQYLMRNLSKDEHYIRFTSWRLLIEYMKLVAEHQDMLLDLEVDSSKVAVFGDDWLPKEIESVWEALHFEISPQYGPSIANQLKEDTELYFPTIYSVFSEALCQTFQNLGFQKRLMKMETLKYMIFDDDFIPSYLVVCETLPLSHIKHEEKKKEIFDRIVAHPAVEVQMHYKRIFEKIKRRCGCFLHTGQQ